MSSRCPDRLAAALVLGSALALALPSAAAERTLRVCAEPDNLPLSNAQQAGFENRIASLLANELHARLVYQWQPQRRGFVRKTFGEDVCDAWIGVPAGLERMLTTRPYYRSGYVFLNRADSRAPRRSFADPRLKTLRIGVQLIGDDLAATPPGLALARAGAVDRVVGYTVYGEGSAAQRIDADLSAGVLDAALVWGPQAGYFIDHGVAPLSLTPALAPRGFALPFAFDIAVGVRKGDVELQRELDAALVHRAADIDAVLTEFHVPRIGAATRTAAAAVEAPRP
jgi:mxaJ protein